MGLVAADAQGRRVMAAFATIVTVLSTASTIAGAVGSIQQGRAQRAAGDFALQAAQHRAQLAERRVLGPTSTIT